MSRTTEHLTVTLIDGNGNHVRLPATMRDFRGKRLRVVAVEAPRTPESTGRIITSKGERYYPSVVDATILVRSRSRLRSFVVYNGMEGTEDDVRATSHNDALRVWFNTYAVVENRKEYALAANLTARVAVDRRRRRRITRQAVWKRQATQSMGRWSGSF